MTPGFGAPLFACVLAMGLAARPRVAIAQAAPTPRVEIAAAAQATSARRLAYDLRIDLPVTIAGASAWLATELLKNVIGPTTCGWCERSPTGMPAANLVDAGARIVYRWPDTAVAETLSNVFGYALAPAAAVGTLALASAVDHSIAGLPLDLLLVAEATSLAMDVNQLVKFAVARERPFHLYDTAPPTGAPLSRDAYLSFFSGHATFTFALATAAGTVATMRGYRAAPAVWALGLTIASFTSWWRIAADRHDLSDVLVGAAWGAGVGFLVPFLFHRPIVIRDAVRVAVVPHGVHAGAGLALVGGF